jgi:hypothetical protein
LQDMGLGHGLGYPGLTAYVNDNINRDIPCCRERTERNPT